MLAEVGSAFGAPGLGRFDRMEGMKGLWVSLALIWLADGPGQAKRAEFQPGVVIDWSHRQVEIDSTVVLREGLLELVACTANSREHESILRINARAAHVYMALGLIGLTPGKPASWDFDRDQPIPATGDPVAIEVRFPREGQTVERNIRHWLLENGKVMRERHWVFAGSVRTEEDDLVAQREGTIVTVVDFGDALLALPESHTADNEELWLEPNTTEIPPLDSKVTLIVRALQAPPLVVTLAEDGRWALNGKPDALDRIARAVGEKMKADPSLSVVVKIPSDEKEKLKGIRRAFAAEGIAASRIRIEPIESNRKGGPL